MLTWPLAVGLAENGHSVTFLQATPNKNPHPNITEMNPANVKHLPPPNLVELRLTFLNDTSNLEWVNSNKFDLVIIDALFNDCAYGLAYKWQAKTIVFGTTHVFDWFPDGFGFQDESSWIPSIHFSQDLPMGFFGRVQASVSYLYCHFNKQFRGLPGLDLVLREKLGMPDMPPVSEMIMNTSLVFINTHYSEELARSLPPFVIPIGGMHVSETVKPLPKEMEEFVKGSGDNGFIYVSFGSEADMSKSPEFIRKIFFSAVGKIKTGFLWRWDGEKPVGMPDNVMTAKWMPQQSILGHPKIRGFITHGGLLSMQEAVYHGVPMIVFPVFAEQDYNAERLHRTGRGIRLDFGSLTEPQLEDAINRLLTDPRIKHEMKLTSARFKDRPSKPVDTALWWTSYILRHEDTSFLRPGRLASSLSWYQRRQLDVWAFLSVTLLSLLYLIIKCCSKLLSLCCGRRKSEKVTKTKKRN
ncbi:UDP-glucuronosyltransferase 2B18 [Orchesella cincta]|uniref:UDP-glucuronosyltransferase n=1 Tax=Orchesella cincta TaxID=48709 RepID=A0A1D2MQN2_ORCCI|nr:UDP-glucuronosyltransferase 2B18 [Orchesella cincta]